MATYRKEFKVTSMAKYLDVSRSGFYDYVKRLKYPIIKIDSILIDFVKETWQCSKTNYGLMRILNKYSRL